MNEFSTKDLIEECKSRAAGHTGEERRFHQALVRTLIYHQFVLKTIEEEEGG
jgi:hypothetical protein